MKVNVIGAGLAGSEAAYYLAKKGVEVTLFEMRPVVKTPAHATANFAELVCSNSLRSDSPTQAIGLLKREMELLGSIVLKAANLYKLEGGTSLMVDRVKFSDYITKTLRNHPNIKLVRKEVTKVPDGYTIIAAGPLASDKLVNDILTLVDSETLNFYDAVAPIVDIDSINLDVCYFKDRYDKGVGSYLNCPMTKQEYFNFYNELINAETVAPKDFEKNIFEGCMPVEVMAKRGPETLTYGPFKPVGLEYNDKKPYAVLQLRPDDFSKNMYNIVGFQTSLKYPEQRRILKMVPGLENVIFYRYGVIHKNTYFKSPEILNEGYQFKKRKDLFLAGQISGVEGYVESAASGLAAAINLYSIMVNKKPFIFPNTTIIGSLSKYVSTPNTNFVPMNANFGIIEELGYRLKRKEKRERYYKRSIKEIKTLKEDNPWM